MKLRIQGNMLRLRLTQKEVSCLHHHNVVESAIRFPSGRALQYRLAGSPKAFEVTADFEYECICILIPQTVAAAWAESSDVAIEGPPDSDLRILIEKDFQCLHKAEERDPDAYPNPVSRS